MTTAVNTAVDRPLFLFLRRRFLLAIFLFASLPQAPTTSAFGVLLPTRSAANHPPSSLGLAKGFGGGPSKAVKRKKEKKPPPSSPSSPSSPLSSPSPSPSPYSKGATSVAIDALTAQSTSSPVQMGLDSALATIQADSASYHLPAPSDLEFFSLLPVLLESRGFSQAGLERIGDFVRNYFLLNCLKDEGSKGALLPAAFSGDDRRPNGDVHAFMRGINSPSPFVDGSRLPIVKALEDNIGVVKEEFQALEAYMHEGSGGEEAKFRSITEMNYDSGWSTLVLHRNSARIPNFPYHLCPTTLKIVESVPIAGRICGFNRQLPGSGIPTHSDGNNMWLTCQIPIRAPPTSSPSYIINGGERHEYIEGKAVVYDTTYEHHTMNESETEDRVVLHIDFWNTLEMSEEEIQVMQYVYDLKGKFMEAEQKP